MAEFTGELIEIGWLIRLPNGAYVGRSGRSSKFRGPSTLSLFKDESSAKNRSSAWCKSAPIVPVAVVIREQ